MTTLSGPFLVSRTGDDGWTYGWAKVLNCILIRYNMIQQRVLAVKMCHRWVRWVWILGVANICNRRVHFESRNHFNIGSVVRGKSPALTFSSSDMAALTFSSSDMADAAESSRSNRACSSGWSWATPRILDAQSSGVISKLYKIDNVLHHTPVYIYIYIYRIFIYILYKKMCIIEYHVLIQWVEPFSSFLKGNECSSCSHLLESGWFLGCSPTAATAGLVQSFDLKLTPKEDLGQGG